MFVALCVWERLGKEHSTAVYDDLEKSSVMVYLYAFEDQDGNAGHDRGCFEFRSDGAHPHVPTASSVSVLIGLEGY